MKQTAAVLMCLILVFLRPSLGGKSLYDLMALDAMGNEVSLQQYRGTVMKARALCPDDIMEVIYFTLATI